VIVAVAVRFLNQDFVLQAGDIGGQEIGGLPVSNSHAGGSAQGESRGGSGAYQSSLALQFLGEIFSGFLLQFGQAHRMFRGFRHRGLHGGRHDGCGEHGVGAGGVDDFRDAQFVVVILGIGMRGVGSG
jgi:hypothetical protein